MINTKKLEKTGFWREYTENPNDGSIFNSTFNYDYPQTDLIAKYLNSGVRILLTRQANICKLHQEIFAPHGQVFFDGTWIWTEGLIHYFQKYGLKIPVDFLKFMVQNDYEVKIVKEEMTQADLELLANIAYSYIDN